MSVLQRVPFYRIPRIEEGRRNRSYDHVFENALRWQPEFGTTERARGLMRRLMNGDTINEDELNLIVVYLFDAVAWYQNDPEPYPGRNNEAINDIVRLRQALT
jgi:hypothetical protein